MPSESKGSEMPFDAHPVDAAMETMQQHLSSGEAVPEDVLGTVTGATQEARVGTIAELILIAELGALITRYRSTNKPINGEIR